MNGLSIFFKLAPVDWKNVRRDSLLMWIPVIPLLLALLIRWGAAPLTEALLRTTGFDLTPWYPLIMASFVITLPGLIGTVTGFLLLDERDDGVLDALLVTPVSARAYVGYRVATPLVAGFVMTVASYPICGLTPLPWIDLVAAALLGGFGAPFMALYLASFADNKVTGFAMMKLMNAVQILPLLAYFVPPPAQFLFGLIPSYWPMKMVWQSAAGLSYGPYLVSGLAVNIAAVGLLVRRFDRIVHR
jgi:fluoroquinolone transport system permease protein